MFASRHSRRINSLSRRAGTVPAPLLEQLEQRQVLAASILPGQALPDRQDLMNAGPIVIALGNRYVNEMSGITGSVVYFDYEGFGRVFVEMFDALPASASAARTRVTPQLVSNFFSYIAANAYRNTIIHRSIPNFIVQGGGFVRPTANDETPPEVPTNPPVDNEPGNLNIRGTIAMAQKGDDEDSATSQWFFNLDDNDFLDIDRGAQGGPFSAFGGVIGNGMSIVDAVAAVQRFNANSFYGFDPAQGPFSNLPLRNFSSAPIQPSNFVNVSNIVRDENREALAQITFSARSSNASLVSASVDVNGNLVLNLGTNRGGTTNITVRATAADGTFVEDTFAIAVVATPVVGTLKVSPKVLATPGGTFKLTAGGVTGRGATITGVEFWVDGDGDGLFDANADVLLGTDTSSSGGFTLTFATIDGQTPWDPGTYAFFARATDSAAQFSNVVTVDGRINELPTIGTFAGQPDPVQRLSSVTFTLTGVSDDSRVRTVEVFRDNNNDNAFTAGIDRRLGNARKVSAQPGTWVLTVSTRGMRAGVDSFFAQAIDENGGRSATAQTTVQVDNLAPAITSMRVSPSRIAELGKNFKVTTSGVRDRDGSINLFQLYRDVNNNSIIDLGDILLGEDTSSSGGWSITAAASALNGFVVGNNPLLGRVRDNDLAFSGVVGALGIVNAAPTIAGPIVFTPNPINRTLKFGVTISGVGDGDGTVRRVEVILSRTGQPGPVSGDKVLGTARFSSATGQWTLSNVSASSIPAGDQTFFIRAFDNDGGSTFTTQVVTVV